jgi:hypothetical protein
MTTAHASDSSPQRAAEVVIRDALAARLGVPLEERVLRLRNGTTVKVDAVTEGESVLAEIYARQGKLRGGQQKKVAQDALKLLSLRTTRPAARLLLVFASDEAAEYALNPKGWFAESLRMWKVEVLVIKVDQRTRDALISAQKRQVMRGLDPEVEATS